MPCSTSCRLISRTIKRLIFWNRRSCCSVRSRRVSSSLALGIPFIIRGGRRDITAVCHERAHGGQAEERYERQFGDGTQQYFHAHRLGQYAVDGTFFGSIQQVLYPSGDHYHLHGGLAGWTRMFLEPADETESILQFRHAEIHDDDLGVAREKRDGVGAGLRRPHLVS